MLVLIFLIMVLNGNLIINILEKIRENNNFRFNLEPMHQKTNNMHMQKERHTSAVQLHCTAD